MITTGQVGLSALASRSSGFRTALWLVCMVAGIGVVGGRAAWAAPACEDFNSGYTTGALIGTHPGWFDGGGGPAITSGIGLAGSVGLAGANNIFTWTAQPFDWNDPGFTGVVLQMDFKSNSAGVGDAFNDDRVGWMIYNNSTNSDHIFGVQLDRADNRIEGYWEGISTADRRPTIATWSPKRGTWYRLRLTVTKLGATQARLDVSVDELNADGTIAAAGVAGGTIADTSALGTDAPNTMYFTGPIWPAFKNYSSSSDGPADNACVEVLGSTPTQHTLTVNVVGSGIVNQSPDQAVYDFGSMVQLTAIPDTGWLFSGWSDDLTGTVNPTDLTITGDMIVTATFVEEPPPGMVCESFDVGYPLGQELRLHPDWFYEDTTVGPKPTAGIGVNGSVGLTNQGPGFAWVARPFNWSDPNLTGVAISMDFQTSEAGVFDDDRVGWTISNTDDSSDYHFGVQMDPGGTGAGGNIEAYWDGDTFGDDGGRSSIVDLPILTPNAWYRLRAEFTKLTPGSAKIDVTLTALDASGMPHAVVVSGTLPDTAVLPNTAGQERPNPAYFTAPAMWPLFKNWQAVAGAADNACVQVLTSPPTQHTVTVNVVGNGTVTKDPDQAVYDRGSVVQLTAVPDAGWLFAGWSEDLTGAANPANLTINGDMIVTATFVEEPPPGGDCENFDAGYELGQELRVHPDWFYEDAISGPVPTAGIGVNGSVGLSNGQMGFAWVSRPFSWSDPDLTGVAISMDFQTSETGVFDDDRVGWTISDTDDSSDYHFGVQMDPGGGGAGGNIEAYWDGDTFGDNGGRTSIVDLPALSPNAWYRLRAEFTKLTPGSARIDVTLTALDSAGLPGAVVVAGTLDDTSLLPDTTGEEIPNPAYFTAPTMWPLFKNYQAVAGAADNACFEIIRKFAFVVVTDLHTSVYQANVELNLQQVAAWRQNPTPDMPAPEFMVITGDFPNLYQTQDSIDLVLGADFPWYPVIGNHEISDDITNFYIIRDTLVPSLRFVSDYGPAGSRNSTYSWNYGNAHFVSLNAYWNGTTAAGADTATDGNITPELRGWLNTDLAGCGRPHRFVFVHEPAYPDNRHLGDSLDQYPANRDAFVTMLNANNVEAMFCGHTHYYEHDTAAQYPLLGNVHQITNAALRNIAGDEGASITYVLVAGQTATFKVYRSTSGFPFTLYEQWTVGGPGPTLPPAAPTGLAATAVSYAWIDLSWTDNADNESGFEIERSVNGGPFEPLASVAANVVTYADTGLAEQTPYCYRVRAVNGVGPSDYTSVECATTPAMPPLVGACESFENGYALGQELRTHPDWFYEDANSGPVPTAGIGVGGSIGLTNGDRIFTWVAHPFNWNAADFRGVNLQMDFQADGNGRFDDDRLGWMISDTDDDSANIFGVQMDPTSGFRIEGYWDGTTGADVRVPIVSLPTLTANGWYRLRAEITKLSSTSARIDVTLRALDAAGNEGAGVAAGSILDTAALGANAPAPKYFTANAMWPAYKNFTAVAGAADNACVEVVKGVPPARVTDGQVALYAFDEGAGTTVHDVSGFGTPLDLTVQNAAAVSWPTTGGLAVNSSTSILSATSAAKVIDAVRTANGVTVEAWITPANTTQNGPARIITISADPYNRNCTLEQGLWGTLPSNCYDVRFRSTATSNDGTMLTTPAGSATTQQSHVVFTRDTSGAARIYVDAVEQVGTTLGGDCSNWNSAYRLALANELTGDRPWRGTFHLVAMFNRALSPAEIAQNYAAGPVLAPAPPTIVTQPADQTVKEGGNATFTVVAAGTAPLSYQWEHNGVAEPGETDPTHTVTAVTMADNGLQCRCVVSNAAGSITSEAATLTVVSNLPPIAEDQAVIATAGVAKSIMLKASDSDGPPPLTFAIATGPANGTLGTLDPATGVVTYTANAGATADNFTFTATDGAGAISAPATVSITISTSTSPNRSDDFNTCSLNPFWTVVDPLGGANVRTTGTGTADALLEIAVPAGASHDAWTTNESVRVVQPADNADFEVQIKLQSAFNAGYQNLGLLVEQNTSTYLRYDVVYDGSRTFVYAATIGSGANTQRLMQFVTYTNPFWLSLQRVGHQWTARYSTNGQSWQTAGSFAWTAAVSQVGVFGGNYSAGTAPAFAAKFDYFLNTAQPLTSEDDPLAGGSTLTRSVVGQGSIVVDPDRATYACGEVITVTAVPAAGWKFDGWGGDLSGTESPTTLTMDRAYSIVATFVPEGPVNNPPVADAQTVTATAGVAKAITLTASDPDGPPPLTFAIATGPTHGTLGTLDPDTGLVTYTANAGAGADSFTFTATDGAGATSAPATVSISIVEGQTSRSDDFNTCALNPFWTAVDPLGGADVRTTGTGTTDALLEISVPAGTSHLPWTTNDSVRVMQTAYDTDFEIQAKFQSTFDAAIQLQGLVVEQDAGTYLRCEVFFDGANAFIYAATLSSGGAEQRILEPVSYAPPFWLGVSRSGEGWTVRYSTDGQAWQSAVSFDWPGAVAQVGVYAGNYSANSAPAFTAKVDYFLNTADPLTAEDEGGGVTLTTAVVGQGSILVDPDRATYACDEVVTVSAVPDAGWKFDGWGGDLSGTESPIALTMSRSYSISAIFSAISGPNPSDDFNTCGLNPFWTVIDPVGGATVQLTGTGTADALLEIAVPAGASHDSWAPNDSVRVMQPADNVDFEVQVKLQSTFSTAYQMLGFLVEQDANTYLRYDVVYNSSGTFVYAATIGGGSGTQRFMKTVTYTNPFWLSLQRVGNQWTARYSTNGQAWQTAGSFAWAATVGQVGVYGGNYSAGTAPAFTAKFDYFLNTADPLATEDGPLVCP